MQLPEKLLQSLEGIEGFDREAFEKVHESGEQVTSIRINPLKNFEIRNSKFEISLLEKVPWTEYGYYLKERPSFTFDPLFHAGCYYVQEASSMFLEQALKQTIDLSKPLKTLDLAAAPGGKSTHIQSLVSKDSLLVSNEVIRSRGNILKDNIIKWGSNNVVVTNNDPKDFARLENYFDVIVVDAPCSGSGLFRRDEEAIGEWSENNVQLCSQRQQRILADVWPALKKEGVLVYSTCSYSEEEDEEIIEWMRKEFSIVNCHLSMNPDWRIITTKSDAGVEGYRFWPDTLIGEIVREKLIPSHALAMSHLASDNIGNVEMDIEQAIRYLQKKDLKEVNTGKGWNLVTYKNLPLGWINVLPTRINNYYPKELRILKDI